ncbi:MAG TPA: ATP-binding protein [Chitinophagaceae bacterium]|nr:ATP-binding protein [Chitinophagaceae bacterium]
MPIKKIVITGPESTGKSTLCAQLAAHYKTAWCPEYAREYLLTYGKNYSFDDLLAIARGQLALEDEYTKELEQRAASSQQALPLFIDTDMYVMKVWGEFVFGKNHRYVLQQIVQRQYDLYLLCNIDLPWTPDELREHPDPEPRKQLYAMYRDLLINQHVPWTVISGNEEERLQQAIAATDLMLQNPDK